MATITRDKPCVSITSVAHDRLPMFRTEALKKDEIVWRKPR